MADVYFHPLRNTRDPSRSMIMLGVNGGEWPMTMTEARALQRTLRDAIAEASEPLPKVPPANAAGA